MARVKRYLVHKKNINTKKYNIFCCCLSIYSTVCVIYIITKTIFFMKTNRLFSERERERARVIKIIAYKLFAHIARVHRINKTVTQVIVAKQIILHVTSHTCYQTFVMFNRLLIHTAHMYKYINIENKCNDSKIFLILSKIQIFLVKH